MRNYDNYRGKRSKKSKIIFWLNLILLILSIGGVIACKIYFKNHFLRNTVINNVDCSFLTLDQAISKISDTLADESISLVFSNTAHEVQGKDFDITLKDSSELQAILENQDNDLRAPRTYTLKTPRSFDKEKVTQYLRGLPELQPQNMVKPQDAYIKVQEDGTLSIEKEVLGTEINFENALSLCIKSISEGSTTIDFRKITNSVPNITSTDKELNQTVNSINSILNTVITYKLQDESELILDKKIMKSWVCTDENGKYHVDFNNITDFVEELDKQVKKISTSISFKPTGLEKEITISGNFMLKVDTEKEIQLIQENLQESGTHEREPSYDMNFLSSYIEVDITRQMVYLYYEGEFILGTSCVTGKTDGHDTPTGVYYLTYKTTNAILRGYNSDGSTYATFVNYWMPFNGGIGFHDALWRTSFGGTIYQYNGSHGCVNLPFEAAQTIYSYINTSMPIIVYCS